MGYIIKFVRVNRADILVTGLKPKIMRNLKTTGKYCLVDFSNQFIFFTSLKFNFHAYGDVLKGKLKILN